MIISRNKLEEIENRLLACYACKSMLSKGRRYPEKEHLFRTVYQRDRDRIIHSTAFRRLEYKTQVFVNHEGDYYRTRLTHTLEVSQIARSIAKALNINENLVEAIALVHDLGHTPFGHSGEDVLNDLMKELGYGGFNHNIQGLRVVDLLEERYSEFCGLNLSWEVREGIAKHSTKFDSGFLKWENNKNLTKNVNYSKRWNIHNLISDLSLDLAPSLETQVVDVADEIAYDNHDLDDGLTSGYIEENHLLEIPMWRQAKEAVEKKYKNLEPKIKKYQIIRYLINLQVTDLINNSKKMIESNNIKSLEDVRNSEARLICFSPEVINLREFLRDFLMQNLYKHYKVVRMADKAKRFLKDIFEVYCNETSQLPPSFRTRLDKEPKEIVICDYIAGMTDRYALDEYKRLFEPYERV